MKSTQKSATTASTVIPPIAAAAPAREPTVRALDALAPHPRQAELFGDPTDADVAALAADIAKRGLQDPVEVTPDNVIVSGHTRVRAARLLGWADVRCVVRHDLAAAGPKAVFAHLVGSNTARRHMSRLARARCVAAVLESEAGCKIDHMFGGREKLKAEVARQFDMSTRNLNRLLAVLRAPRAVQDAYDRGEISLVAAARAGRPSNSPAAAGAGVRFDKAFRRVVLALGANLPRFETHTDWLDLDELAAAADLLGRAARVLADLADRGRAHAASPESQTPRTPKQKEFLAALLGGGVKRGDTAGS